MKLVEAYLTRMNEDGKNAYIFGCIVSTKSKTLHTSAKSHRKFSAAYYVTIDGKRRRMCKNAFCKLHDIQKGKVRHLSHHIASGQHIPYPSMHGKHLSRPHKLPDDAKDRIRQHISSFPAESSHYSRSHNTGRLYLSPLLTISKMYDEYKSECGTKGLQAASSTVYRDIFI